MKKFSLEIIVFTAGAVVMILELTASRVLAPFTGTTIIAWTSLLGIILASLSLGYWWGGKLADKKPSYLILSKIIFLSGAWIFLISYLKTPVLEILEKEIADLRILSIAASTILFSVPNVLLGMVFPFSIKLKLKRLKLSGQTAGGLYALSTLGSIFGTFLTGFFLLAFLGSTKILVLASFLLFFLSFLTSPTVLVLLSVIVAAVLISKLQVKSNF